MHATNIMSLRYFIHPGLWYLFADNLAASSTDLTSKHWNVLVCFFLYPGTIYGKRLAFYCSFFFRNEQLNILWSIQGNFLKFEYARQWIYGFKHFLFLPRTLGKWSNSDEHIVQLGCFNHHLIILVFIIVYTLPPRIMEVKNGCTSNNHYLSNFQPISIIFRFHDYGWFRVVGRFSQDLQPPSWRAGEGSQWNFR